MIHCAFIATVTREPEFKQGKSGKPFANFPCETGDQRVNVITFGDLAETIAKDAKKGDRVFIEGAISLANWTNSEGESRYGLAVSASRAEKLFAAQPTLPIVLPAIRKRRPTFALFRKAKKTLAPGEPAPFNDELPF